MSEVRNECGLLDIGVKTNALTDAKRVFHEDQNGERKFRVSTEIDEEYVKEKGEGVSRTVGTTGWRFNQQKFFKSRYCTEEMPSCSAAGQTERYRKYSLQISVSNLQSQLDKNLRRELGNIQNFLCVVDAIATISYRCAISIEKARKAFQVVGWYGIATDTI